MNDRDSTSRPPPDRARIRPWRALRVVAGVLSLAHAAAACADYEFCLFQHIETDFGYCADTSANQVVQLDSISKKPVTASGGTVGDGYTGLASASAGPGGLHATVSATSTAGPPPDGFSYSGGLMVADALIFDSGSIVDPTHKLADGTPVDMRFTMTVEGTFVNSGQATTTLFVGNTALPAMPFVDEAKNFVYSAIPHRTEVIDVQAAIGDAIFVYYALNVSAGAGNNPAGTSYGLADAGNTALLDIDFLQSGVTFDSASGFDYATSAVAPPPEPGNPLPEPAPLALLGVGAVAWIAERRRLARASARALPIVCRVAKLDDQCS